jgi:thioredoxin-related protein
MFNRLFFFFFCCFGWMSIQAQHTRFADAQAVAVRENKPILLLLSGEDWCAPCVKLKKKVWNEPDFQDFISKEFVRLELYIPKQGSYGQEWTVFKEYDELKNKYQAPFLPTILVLAPSGDVLQKIANEFSKKTILTQLKALLDS